MTVRPPRRPKTSSSRACRPTAPCGRRSIPPIIGRSTSSRGAAADGSEPGGRFQPISGSDTSTRQSLPACRILREPFAIIRPRPHLEVTVLVPVSITVNGRLHRRDVEPRELLVHFIRDLGGVTGTKVGC